MIGNTSSDGGRGLQGLVNSHKTVVHHVERDRCRVILNLLGERVRQAGDAAHTHARCQILPFNVPGADVLRIGFADDRFFLAGSADRRAVPLLCFGIVAIDFYEPSVVYVFAECFYDGLEVRSQPVRRQLNTIRKSGGHIRDKHISGHRIALADSPAWNELRIRINCRPGPNIASDMGLGDGFGYLLLLAIAERPGFINLNPFAREVPESSILESRASGAQFHQKFVDSVPCDSGDSGRGAHRVPVHQTPNDLYPFERAQRVHGSI